MKNIRWKERQIKAVLYVKEKGKITLSKHKKLAKEDINERTLRRELKNLVDKNILKSKGEKRGRYYELSR